jgi:hypothetical protein
MPSCGIVYVASLVKIVAVVQATSRSCLSNLRGCNVGIGDGLVYQVGRLDFSGIMTYIHIVLHDDWFSYSGNNEVYYYNSLIFCIVGIVDRSIY